MGAFLAALGAVLLFILRVIGIWASGGLYTFSYLFKVTWLQKEENAAVMRFLRCNCGVTKSVTGRVTTVHQKGKPICSASASVISEKFSAPVSGLVTRSQPF